jgi:hypothetical protein
VLRYRYTYIFPPPSGSPLLTCGIKKGQTCDSIDGCLTGFYECSDFNICCEIGTTCTTDGFCSSGDDGDGGGSSHTTSSRLKFSFTTTEPRRRTTSGVEFVPEDNGDPATSSASTKTTIPTDSFGFAAGGDGSTTTTGKSRESRTTQTPPSTLPPQESQSVGASRMERVGVAAVVGLIAVVVGAATVL